MRRLGLTIVAFAATAACESSSSSDDVSTVGASSGSTTSADASTVGEASSGPSGDVPPGCVDASTNGATATCLRPTREAKYYIAEAEAYFDTLDIDAPRDSVPNYHPQVARWEWPPWLLLTGYTDMVMNDTAEVLRQLDPSTVPVRDCRFFDVQPFARCYVEFEYEGGRCPIYEEFTFNDAGEMTFIEAWSDLPALLPQDASDPWAEDPSYPRLATKIPGLGKPDGTIDLESPEMAVAMSADPEVADFVMRARDWRGTWIDALQNAEPNFFAVGCGWSTE